MKNNRDNINKQIQFIIKQIERNILEIWLTPDYSRFFIYDSFEPGYTGSATSVEYHTGKALEITDFLEIPRSEVLGVSYKQALARFIEGNEFLTVRYDKGTHWLAYS